MVKVDLLSPIIVIHFLQDDIDLKFFDHTDMSKLAYEYNQELYSNYK